MNHIKQITSDEALKEVWPTVRYGLEKIIEKAIETTWIPEDFYHDVKTGNTKLIVGMQNGDILGFIGITPQAAWDGREAHVWALWLNCPLSETLPFVDEIKEFCKNQLGCRRMVMLTQRKGWEKTAKVLGMSEFHVQYKAYL